MSYYITLCMLPSLGYSIAPKKKRHRQTEVREPRSSPQRIALARVNKLGWEGTPRWDRATGSIYDPGTRPPSGAHTRGIDRARAGILQGPDACRWGPDGRRETERRRGKIELRLHWLLFYDKVKHPPPMRGIRSPALADFRPLA